ncbi:MAG: 4Fe-4S binding protein [Firmicutes bacterium]|nr:4Fe-4S binding protein [Bacillota bacterium]
MKIVATKPELCIACKLCEEACSQALFGVTDSEKSAIRISENENGEYDINVCDQCGECLDICQVQALMRDENGIIVIDKDKCVHCYACVGFCPVLAMRYHQDIMGPFKCISCGACTEVCATGAIFMQEI